MINPEELQKFWCSFNAATTANAAGPAPTSGAAGTPPPALPPNMEHLKNLWAFMLQASNGNAPSGALPSFLPGAAAAPFLPGVVPNGALLGVNVEQVGFWFYKGWKFVVKFWVLVRNEGERKAKNVERPRKASTSESFRW